MRREATLAARSVHPVLTPAALGLLPLGGALDVLASGRAGALTWLAFWVIVLGVALGTWCTSFALLDWVFFAELGDSGVWGLDGFATATVVGLYGVAALTRVGTDAHGASPLAMALEVGGTGVLFVKAWVGRELAAALRERR